MSLHCRRPLQSVTPCPPPRPVTSTPSVLAPRSLRQAGAVQGYARPHAVPWHSCTHPHAECGRNPRTANPPDSCGSIESWMGLPTALRAICERGLLTSRTHQRRAVQMGSQSGLQGKRPAAAAVLGISPAAELSLLGSQMHTSNRSACHPCSNRVSATSRTAVYGPVRTVVWEGRGREAPPIPINLIFGTHTGGGRLAIAKVATICRQVATAGKSSHSPCPAASKPGERRGGRLANG